MSSTSRLSQAKTNSPSEVRLVEVLDAYLSAAQEGTAPARDVLLAEHPDLAADLEACLASLEFIGQASLIRPPLVADDNAVEAGEVATGIGDLGDFRLIAEVGRGGMGVVYEAMQLSLNRRVALKVLPFAAAMDPTQLRRFQTEALAAAQLHHTHIVPVYSVGCERGVHYYAMQFIEGQTLAQAIAERRRLEEPPRPSLGRDDPSPPRGEGARRAGEGAAHAPAPGAVVLPKRPASGRGQRTTEPADPGPSADCARRADPGPARTADRRSPIAVDAPAPRNAIGSTIPTPSSRTREYIRTAAALGIQAAEALDHAHKFGIVHRDIKPANLLVDTQGNLWITDFGLARLQDDAGLTISGDLLGTLRYMSPEQALGKRGYLDHRTDIYSLGATLYELLTLRPAVEGRDRQEILRRIAEDEPVAPRRIAPDVPRDLETILLKTLAKEPEARYATARDLADDLGRFLEHRPLRARRLNMLERASKWARRHPARVGTVISVLVLAVIGLSASLVAVNNERARTAGKAREVEEKSAEVRRLAQTLEWELYVSRVNQAQGDYDAGNVERALSTLDACPKVHRNWEWRYVARQCRAERYAVRAHADGQGVYRLPVRFLPGGGSWVSGSLGEDPARRSGSLKLWDTATGRCLNELVPGGLPPIGTLAVSPDGRRIAVGLGDPGATIQVRELPGGRLVSELRGPRAWGASQDLEFAPDGRRLADGRENGRLVVWNLDSRKPVLNVAGHPNYAFAVAFDPRGQRVASAARDGLIHFWDPTTGALLRTLKGHEGAIFDLAFSPDGRKLASGGWDQTVRIWNVDTGGLALAIPTQSGFIAGVEFLPDGDRIALWSGQSVRIFSAQTGREALRVSRGHQHGAGFDVSPDGALFLASEPDGTVRLWDIAQTAPRVLRTADWVNQVAFSPDAAMIAAADAGGQVELWDVASGREVHVMKGHDEAVRSVSFTPDGARLVSTSWDGSAGVWDAASGRELKTLIAPSRPKHDRRQVYLKPLRGSSIEQGSVHPDGSRLATAGWDGMVHVWELPSGVERLRYTAHNRIVWGVSYSPDGSKLASVGGDRTVRLWDAQSGRDIWSRPVDVSETGTIQRQMLAFSPDGAFLAVCAGYEAHGPYRVEIHDVESGAIVRTLENPGSQVNAVTYSPDGTRIATAGEDQTVKLWDTATSQVVFVLRGHTASVLAVAFSPDGQKLASGSVDATVRLWDAPRVTERGSTATNASSRSLESLNDRYWSFNNAFSQPAPFPSLQPPGPRFAPQGALVVAGDVGRPDIVERFHRD